MLNRGTRNRDARGSPFCASAVRLRTWRTRRSLGPSRASSSFGMVSRPGSRLLAGATRFDSDTFTYCSSDRSPIYALHRPRVGRRCLAVMAGLGRQSPKRLSRQRRRYRELLPRSPSQPHIQREQRLCPDTNHLQSVAGGRLCAAPRYCQLSPARGPDRGIDVSAHDQRGVFWAITRAHQRVWGAR